MSASLWPKEIALWPGKGLWAGTETQVNVWLCHNVLYDFGQLFTISRP